MAPKLRSTPALIGHPCLPRKMWYACSPMTVCIAAAADSGKALVMVCDQMLSTDAESADEMTEKLLPVSSRQQWWALVAGTEHAIAVVDALVAGLLSLSDPTNTVEYVAAVASKAYQSVRLDRATSEHLQTLGLSIADIQGDEQWKGELRNSVQSYSIGVDLIVAGFDWNGDARIITVSHPGKVVINDMAGWSAIGAGCFSASATLLFHSVNPKMPVARVLYHACEAKFMSESAPGVGKKTTVKVASALGSIDPVELSSEWVAGIKEAWNKDGRPRLPSGIVDKLEQALKQHPTAKFKSLAN